MAGWGFYFVATSVADVGHLSGRRGRPYANNVDRTPPSMCALPDLHRAFYAHGEAGQARDRPKPDPRALHLSKRRGPNTMPNRPRVALRHRRARHAKRDATPPPTRRHTCQQAAQRLVPAQTLRLDGASPPTRGIQTRPTGATPCSTNDSMSNSIDPFVRPIDRSFREIYRQILS
jgi:hypothetical protein